MIEFKYYSNNEFRRLSTTIDAFELQPADTQQVAGYVAELRAEYPEAQIAQFVIYCFGNQGYRVFAL